MEAPKITAVEEGAVVAFLDQCGLSMTPSLRKTWAPVGHTPILKTATRCWAGISVMGAVTVSPIRRRTNLYLQLYPRRAVRGPDVAAFLRQLLRRVPGRRLIVILDRARIHDCAAVHRVLERHPRLKLEYLPPYAPDLNPIEWCWGYLKTRALANYCPQTLDDLERQALNKAAEMRRRPDLLASFVHASALDLRVGKGHFDREAQ